MPATSKSQARSSAPVIPAIPRIFEVKKSIGITRSLPVSTKTEEEEDAPKTPGPETKGSAPPAALPEASDWASLAAEDEHIDTPTTNSAAELDTDVAETPKAELPEEPSLNGHDEHDHALETQAFLRNGHHRQESQISLGPHVDGYQPPMPQRFYPHPPVYPPGLAPFPPHQAQHISFGSFGENFISERSSPTLPPSATSTHFTQPTPLSDTHSQTSRGGHANGIPEQSVPRLQPSSFHPVKTMNQGHGGPDLVAISTATFNDRNRDDLLKTVQGDFFAGGATELGLTVSTQDGRDSFRIWRAICRRSLELNRLLEQYAVSGTGAPVEISSASSFVTMESVRSVIQSLYGNPLLSAQFLNSRQPMHHRRPLEFIATGYLLGAGRALDFGTDLALKTMHWEALPANFQFCLEGSEIDYGSGKDSKLVELHKIVRFGRQHSVDILAQSLDCIIREICSEEGFKFDDHAAYFPDLGGGFHARPVSVSLPGFNPQVSPANGSPQIQFGNLGNFYRHKHQTLSSILLSLPLVVLQHVLSHIHPSIVHEVVQEREKRRLFAIKGGITPYHAHFQELVMPTSEFNRLRAISKKSQLKRHDDHDLHMNEGG